MPKQQTLRVIGGSVPRQSNQTRALQAKTRHSFVPGRGYWEHDQPPVIHGGPPPAPACDPPVGTPDGSRHVLEKTAPGSSSPGSCPSTPGSVPEATGWHSPLSI